MVTVSPRLSTAYSELTIYTVVENGDALDLTDKFSEVKLYLDTILNMGMVVSVTKRTRSEQID